MCLARTNAPGPAGLYVCGSGHLQAAKAILGVLSDKAIGKMKFSVDGFAVKPDDYSQVAKLIRSNRILVYYNRAVGTAAYYYPKVNNFEVGFTNATTLTKRALVAHECTHAVFDLLNYRRATVGTSETAAHVAQLIFFVFHSPSVPLRSGDPKRNLIFYNAGYLAQKILKGQTPTAAEYDYVKKAVCDHRDYAPGTGLCGYNGI